MTSLVVAVAFMAPGTARAQAPKRPPVIGVLATTVTTPGSSRLFDAFKQSLREGGWVEGETIRLELRWAEGREERFPELAAELVRLKVDVIVASGSQATRAAKETTAGNVTGVTNQFSDLAGKNLQLAREVVPQLRHVGILWTPVDQGSALGFKEAQERYASLGVKVTSAPVRSSEDFDAAFEILAREHPAFLMVHPTPVISRNRQRVAEFALRKRLPTITGFRVLVEDGSMMMSYGPDFADLFRQAGLYVNRILKGARPADLPVEQPTRFELVVNRRVAKALGLEMPPGFLARVDHLVD